ncbi:MAG: dipeptidase [Bacteroidetes bacterium]|nr:dipeptidase [Bacteroidota bacterium]
MLKFYGLFFRIFLSAGLIIVLLSCANNEERLKKEAEEIHKSILTIDSHVDTPLMFSREGFDIGQRNEHGRLDFPRMKEGGLDAAFFAVFIGQGESTPEGFEIAKRRAFSIFSQIHEAVEKNADQAGIALSPDDAYRLKNEGKSIVYIGIENGYPIGYDIELLKEFYNLGARYLGLCHSHNNHMCDSSSDSNGELHGGLSEYGKEIIRELNRLGMLIDVSHMSDKSFYDVLKITKAPIIASHSNARALCDIDRNLDDDMLVALAENGGVIQLCLLTVYVKTGTPNPQRDSAVAELKRRYNNYENLSDEQLHLMRQEWSSLNEKYPRELATVSDLVDHLDYIVRLIGIDHVGIGSDFDGGGQLDDCRDVSQMKNITIELLRRGYSKHDIEKIWGGNFIRVFRSVERISEEIRAAELES